MIIRNVHHFILIYIRFEIVVSRDEAKRNLFCFQDSVQLCEILFPEIFSSVLLIPHEPAHYIASDSYEIRFLLSNHVFNLIYSPLVCFKTLTEMRVSQLHYLESIV